MLENNPDSFYMTVELKDRMMAHFLHNIDGYARMIKNTVQENELKWPTIYEALLTRFVRLKAELESGKDPMPVPSSSLGPYLSSQEFKYRMTDSYAWNNRSGQI